jgi:putative ABC transport system permease protein
LIPHYEMLREQILEHPDAVNVTASYDLPFFLSSAVGMTWDEVPEDDQFLVSYNMVDFDFIETMEIGLVEGRSFSREYAGDDSIAYMINETAMKKMGLDHAVGHTIHFNHPHLPEYLRNGTIIGVVKDFNIRPLKETIPPLVLRIYRPFYRNLYVRYSNPDPSSLLAYLENMQETLYPGLPFQYSFLDLDADQMYEMEFRTGRIIKYLTLISILISCLGLFGMVIFELELRTREIAIRKVLASSFRQIFILIMYRYVKWVLLAFCIASPVAFIITSRWLREFTFRIAISPWTYLWTLLGILLIAILTIGVQTRRSAMVNPAEILKFE